MSASLTDTRSGELYRRALELLPSDPRERLLNSGEPASRYVALTALLDRDPGDAEVRQVRREVLAGVKVLVERLPDWEEESICSGHHSPSFTPNLLLLLSDHFLLY